MNHSKITLFAILSFFTLSVHSQNVIIPDDGFRSFLMAEYPSCFNAQNEMDTTCSQILLDESLVIYSTTKVINLDGLQYFKGLTYFSCTNNDISSIPTLPPSITYFNVGNNNLTNLPELNENLETLYAYDNKISSVLSLPQNLKFFSIGNNLLTSLPNELPPSLIEFYCQNNLLVLLPNLPNTLKEMDCSGNDLTTLPTLPNNLEELYCGNNILTSLPKLPSVLRNLSCQNNQIEELPKLSDSIISVSCWNNKIATFPDIPVHTNYFSLYISGNDIDCLPYIPRNNLENMWLQIDSTINCATNKFEGLNFLYRGIGGEELELNDFPVCNPSNNVNQCVGYPYVEGKVFYDLNKNNLKDSDERYVSNIKLTFADNYSFSNDSGAYLVYVGDTGIKNFSVSEPTNFETIPDKYELHIQSFDTSFYYDIALQPITEIEEISTTLISSNAARPGFNYTYTLHYKNSGTVAISDLELTLEFDENYLSIDSFSLGNVITENFLLSFNEDLPIGKESEIKLFTKISPSAPLGDTIFAYLHNSVNENIDTLYSIITGSFDPNDKLGPSTISKSSVILEKTFDYTIRFQNTGTDTAFTVVIMDTLAEFLQSNSLEVLASSHSCKTTVIDNTISFEFINILLPDSNINEPYSHGFVKFRIKPINSLNVNDEILNTAHIFFDYNEPIITNTVSTIVKDNGKVTSINSSHSYNKYPLIVFPNPAKDKVYVDQTGTIRFYNELGQLILKKEIKKGEEILLSPLEQGVYYYSIDSYSGKIFIE